MRYRVAYVPLPHFCVPRLPPPEVYVYDMVWNKKNEVKRLLLAP
jgi:hypothetical protein